MAGNPVGQGHSLRRGVQIGLVTLSKAAKAAYFLDFIGFGEPMT